MSPKPVATPSAARVRAAYAKAGATLRAATVLGVNYRTLERRMATSVELRAAADLGRQQFKASRPRPPHGTVSGYWWELKRRPDVTPCAECRAANAADTAARSGGGSPP